MREPLLIGNNLALLVAASELAKRGRTLTLIADGKPLGGHFSGLRVDGHAFDLGMVLIEKLASSHPGADLRSYDSSVRNDWTRFADRAAHWLEAQVPTRRTPTLQCLVEGRFVADYLIANRLNAFHSADPGANATLDRSDPRHAANKNIGSAYDHLSYGEAARLNHGEVLHARFIEPFVRKVFNVSSDAFEARYHRAAWVPLYYPETLAAEQRGEPIALPEYVFWTTDEGCIARLVATLIERLRAAPTVTLVAAAVSSIERSGRDWVAQVEGGGSWAASQMALGLPAERGRALFGLSPLPAPMAASVAVTFCLMRADAVGRPLSCLMVVDESFCTYRLTDQDAQAGIDVPWHRVVLEASPNMLASHTPPQAVETVMRRELCALMNIGDEGAVRVLKTITARNALTLPTTACVAQAKAAHRALAEAAPGAALTGALLGYGAASLNDQIVQGLKIAEEFS
jgi:predicted NAD/FAD-dependent oxidoreductase